MNPKRKLTKMPHDYRCARVGPAMLRQAGLTPAQSCAVKGWLDELCFTMMKNFDISGLEAEWLADPVALIERLMEATEDERI